MSERGKEFDDAIEREARDTLAYLETRAKERKLIHDQADDRWFVYAFDTGTTEVTSIPDEVAECLVACSWVEERGDDARVDIGGPYGVFVITDRGRDAAAPAGR